jgi:hypothetical protein
MTAEAATGRRFRLPVVYPTGLALAFILLLWTSSGSSMFAVPRLLLFTILVGLLITLIMTLAFRDRDRGGLAATGIVAAILLGSDPKAALPGLALVGIVILDGLLKEPRRFRIPWPTVTRVGNAVATILLLAVAIRAIGDGLPARMARDWATEGPLKAGPAAAYDPDDPDIYLILLDGYLRPDRQASLFGHDISGFVNQLEARGFQLAERSRSNYLATDASLTTMFNFAHLEGLGDPSLRQDIRARRVLEENKAFEVLREHGYETVSIGSGYEMVTIRSADRFIDTGQVNELELVAISNTLVRPLLRWFAPDFLADQMRARITSVLGAVGDLDKAGSDRPRLVFAHVPSPHDPIVFAADGSPVYAEVQPGATLMGQKPPTVGEYGARYGGQVDHLNRLTLDAIDRIRAEAGPNAAIMLFSDHGSAYGLDWTATERSDLDERTANLVAVSMPDGSMPLPDDVTLVNALSGLLNATLGSDIAPQSDEHYRFAGSLFDLEPFEVPE